VLVDVLLEPLKRKLITVLKLSIGCTVLLDSVVCQVDEGIINVFQINTELGTAGTQIALWEKVEVLVLGKEDPNSDVELPLVD
jgi:hypothetical protein